MSEQKKWCVYIHTNKINGKKYIGITSNSVEQRWGMDGNGYKGQMFYNAILKYGWDGFTHEVVNSDIGEDEAKGLEIELISKYQANTREYGYNLTGGGDGLFNPSDDLRQQISARVSGSGNPMFGKTHTDKVKKKLKYLAKQRVGKKAHRYNKTFTPEQKENISASLKGKFDGDKNPFYGKKHNTETRRHLSKIAIEKNMVYGNNPNAKPVICDGIEFDSVKSCANHYDLKYLKMVEWLLCTIGMPQKFVEMQLRYKDEQFRCKPETNSNLNGVVCNGAYFQTLSECALHYNIAYTTMHGWLKLRQCMPEEFIKMKLRYANKEFVCKEGEARPVKHQVICDNIIYESIRECASCYDINEATMGIWLAGKSAMPKRFIELGLQYLGENREYKQSSCSRRKVECNDKIYNTVSECAKEYNVNATTMRLWLTCDVGMPDRFIKLQLKYEGEEFKFKKRINTGHICCEDKIFSNLKECAIYYDVKYTTMNGWMNGSRKMPEKFHVMGLRYYVECSE